MSQIKGSVLASRMRDRRYAGKVWKLGAAAVIAVVVAQAALACDACRSRKCASPCSRGGLMLCCPDDYCPKPLPCLPCPQRSCCPDNYCRKPLPCVPCPKTCWRPDDYCRKPMPRLCWLPPPVKYSCGPCPSR
jgi:hypothetical protein